MSSAEIRRLTGIALLLAALVSGCAPISILNASFSANDFKKGTDLAYGSDPRQKLDVYTPLKHADQADVVIFFYGGRWQSGEKSDYQFVADGLAANGLITIIPDYRRYPQVDWRDFLADSAAAYRWVEAHIASYGGNPRRIFLMGHSAGAHIAAMLALDQNLRDRAGSVLEPCGMIGLAGPYDFLPFTDADVQNVFRSASHPIETQPIYFADRSDPSLLLLMGDADTTVKPRNAERLASVMRERGGNATLIKYHGVGHATLLLSLDRSLRFIAPTLRDATRFIRTTECN